MIALRRKKSTTKPRRSSVHKAVEKRTSATTPQEGRSSLGKGMLTCGDAIRIARARRKISAAGLARMASLRPETVFHLESGRAPLGLYRAERLAKALGVHPSTLLWPNGWKKGPKPRAVNAPPPLAKNDGRRTRRVPADPKRLTSGDALRALRDLRSLTQTTLATMAGIGQVFISAIEAGREVLGNKRAEMLARALYVHPSALLWPNGWETDKERVRDEED